MSAGTAFPGAGEPPEEGARAAFFERMGRLLRTAASGEPHPASLQAARARFIERSLSSGRRGRALRRMTVAAAALGALAGAAAMAMTLAGRTRPPLTYQIVAPGTDRDARALARPGGTLFRFSDGTELELAKEAKGWLAQTSASGAELVVESGTLDARVVPRAGGRWTVLAGPFLVRVTGTRFRTQWRRAQGELELELFHGSVVVDGPGFSQRVSAGQRLLATRAGLVRVAPFDPAEAARIPREPPGSGASASWATRVARGELLSVLEEMTRLGLEVVLAERGAEDLGALATAARLEGRTEVARRALQAQRRRFPATAGGHEAAFFLGRIAEDAEGDTRAALDWYDRYLREAPDGALAQEALGRKLAALARLPRDLARGRARATARLYLARFPQGPRAALARQLADRE